MNRYRWLMIGSIFLAVATLTWGINPAQAGPGGGTYYANSPAGGGTGTALRKFVDRLPGLGLPGCTVSSPAGTGSCNENGLGQYIPIANPDTTTFPGSDYYVIGLKDYRARMHSDLPLITDALGTGTRFRGYYQINNGNGLGGTTDHSSRYLGPVILATKDKPVRVKFENHLGVGSAGNLFIPVDTTMMGAGLGPLGASGGNYTQNRATLHLHGGLTPWISDGTPHQWVTPIGENTTTYLKGASQQNVPDMPDPGQGAATFYWTNQQSNRLMFYHDHAYGITRLNVYAGEAAGYVLTDPQEEALITAGTIPGASMPAMYRYGIPLVIQDKSFVPQNISTQDAKWTNPAWGPYGELWFPHVYEPNEDPNSPDGLNPLGRWDYGPSIWPPTPVANPTLPVVSQVPEAFMDTSIVNGAAYPFLPVDRTAYRFRILSAGNDRSLNLQLYYAATASGTVCRGTGAPGACTEINMVSAPDGRDGGIPDPDNAGPQMIQIGTEGGFLPNPVVLENTPISFDDAGNVADKTLLLMPAERADVIIDFSQVPAGSTIILYNDAPAALPGGDPRYDYYTDNPDETSSGGAPSTLAGFGPNIRTIMQFRVSASPAVSTAFNLAALQNGATGLPHAFNLSQPAPIVPANTYAKLLDTSMSVNGQTYPFHGKSINEGFESAYGRITAVLGTQSPDGLERAVPLAYTDPATEILPVGKTQLWKIVHNGVDSHPIHFHLLNVQVVNRVGYDGSLKAPAGNELGWKETVRMNPQEVIIVAFKAVAPVLPFPLPDSVRPLDVTTPVSASNPLTNFGHEYVWHCHILGHEELDLMRPLVLNTNVKPTILWRHPTAGTDVVWNMDGSTYLGTEAIQSVVDPNWKIVGRGDFNGTGNLDILWRNSVSGQNTIWNMNGTTLLGSTSLPTLADLNWQIVGVGDFSQDTKPDILWRNRVTGENAVWNLNGTTFLGYTMIQSQSDPNWKIVGVGDFNKDGKPDILWRNSATGENAVWNMNGTTYLGYIMLPGELDLNWKIMGVSDFNNDVNPDVLWRNTSTGANVVWTMDGPTRTGVLNLPTFTDQNWIMVGN